MAWGYVGGAVAGAVVSNALRPSSSPQYNASNDIAEQARVNRVNTTTPYGSTVWNESPTGQWSQTNQFSPELQNIWNNQLQNVGFNYTPTQQNIQAPGAFNPGSYADTSKAATQAYFDQQKALLDPYYQQQQRSFDQTMANRGLPSGSEAYDTNYANLHDAMNRAYQNAANQAILTGQQVQNQAYNQGANTYNMNAQTPLNYFGANQNADTNYYNQLSGANQINYNQLAGLLGMNQAAPNTPLNVSQPYQQQYQGQLLGYQNNQNQYNNLWNTAGNVAGMWAMSPSGSQTISNWFS